MGEDDDAELIRRFADLLAAMDTGTAPVIVRLFLSADAGGMVVGKINSELAISSVTKRGKR